MILDLLPGGADPFIVNKDDPFVVKKDLTPVAIQNNNDTKASWSKYYKMQPFCSVISF